MFIHIYLKKLKYFILDILYKPFIAISACKAYHTVTVYTTAFLKMNPQVQNM